MPSGDRISSRRRNFSIKVRFGVFRIVVIHGISGLGKTTIVKYVYDKIALDFECRCFIEDVSSYEGMWGQRWKYELQKDVISCLTSNRESTIISSNTNRVAKIMKLIMGRKVLLVLDGVHAFKHLEALGIHDACFSCLSRIIVTTTNKESLVNLPCTPYNVRLLDMRESFELFVRLTFKKDNHVDEMFVKEVVCCAGGLPLVLDVWSCHFKCYEKKHWRNILETLKRIPLGDIQKKLQVSYDSLNKTSKNLFLDIACFFHGVVEKEMLVKVSQDDALGLFFLEIEIQHLANKGLVKTNESTYVVLHEVIKEMGKEVVRQENEDEPGKRTRLTDDRDIARVLEDCSGTDSVESIIWIPEELTYVKFEALRKMRKLRLLNFYGHHPSWLCDTSPLCFKRMKFVSWSFFPLKCLDTFDMENLVYLELENAKLEILWEGMKNFKKLKILKVTHSESLTRTGNFSGLENLEELRLEMCMQLQELHESISKLHKLRFIALIGSVKLESIPNLPPSIEVIFLEGCTNLGNLPYNIDQLHKLRALSLDGCVKLESIPNLPPSIKDIDASNCTSLLNLPSNMSRLQLLSKLHLDGCFKLEPHNLKKVSSLFKDLFVTRQLCIGLWVAKIPDWCRFHSIKMGDVLSIVVPTNMDKKICGVIVCATLEFDITIGSPYTYFSLCNKTKTTSDEDYRMQHLYLGGTTEDSTCALLYPFGDRTLMVEAGDLVELEFFDDHNEDRCVINGGLRLIYEDDLLDYALLIQNAYG